MVGGQDRLDPFLGHDVRHLELQVEGRARERHVDGLVPQQRVGVEMAVGVQGLDQRVGVILGELHARHG